LFEYVNEGPTYAEILKPLLSYPKFHRITKYDDSIFSQNNLPDGLSTEDLFDKLGVRKLVVAGANGHFCVHTSISEAINMGFHVRTNPESIADFTMPQFQHPVSYGAWPRQITNKHSDEDWIADKRFREVKSLDDISFEDTSYSKLRCVSLL